MTLTEAAEFTHKAKKYILIPVGIIMFVWFVIRAIMPPTTYPPEYITPDFMCGPLPELTIEGLDVEGDITYKIETTEGGIPDLPKVVNVFKYDHPGQSLFALREAQQTAELLKFNKDKYTRISETEYQWSDPLTKRTLIIETSNQNVRMTTDFTDPSVNTREGTLPSKEEAIQIAQTYLQSVSLLTRDFSAGPKITHLVQIGVNGQLSKAPSLREADFIRVDFTRSRDLITIDPELVEAEELGTTLQDDLINEDTTTIQPSGSSSKEVKRLPTHVFNESPYYGTVSVLVGGLKDSNTREHTIFGLESYNWIVPQLPCGTYSLISAQEAVRRVQSGEAALTYLLEKDGDDVIPYETREVVSMTIFEVTLGYYDTMERQDWLQPIYVISGDAQFASGVFGTFYFYVPAVDYKAIPNDAGINTTSEEIE